MNQKEFSRLTDTCDDILQRFSLDNSIIAIPWLHVLNAHPNSIHQYRFAFQKRSAIATLGKFLQNSGYILAKLAQSIFEFRSNKGSKEVFEVDVVFVSHLVSTTGNDRNRDFYFSTLPMNMHAATGQVAMIGLIDHTASQKTVVMRTGLEKGETKRIIFRKTLSFAKEIGFAFNCFSSYFKLIRESRRLLNKENATIFQEAALYAMAPETLAALRIQEESKQLLKQTKANVLVITWEGRSWERLAIAVARKINVSIRILAYQHTVLLASSHALKRSLGRAFDPDIIFTIGNKTAEILRATNEYKETAIIKYGSYRLSITQNGVSEHIGDVMHCLVTPEGIESECILLFDFAILLANRFPAIKFIFRTHPVLPYEMLQKKYPRFVVMPQNCSISTVSDMNEDFKKSDFLLYRGSSVSIYAAMQGLRPVYYSLPDEISIDPLYQLNEWRIIIQNENDFTKAVKMHKETPADVKKQMYHDTRVFCEDYLEVPDENIFYNIISSKKQSK